MSRSEQLHDPSMEEILAAIRKIITDDGPVSPDADAFASAAIDEFREATAALARGRPGGYMSDLTRALAGEPPLVSADDDILASATAAPTQPASDDDLFETETVSADAPALVLAGEDEEIIEDLGDPIMLGPEIELVEEPEAADSAAQEAHAATEVGSEPATDEPPMGEAVEAASLPPPPPPVVSMPEAEAVPSPAAEPVAEAAKAAEGDIEPADAAQGAPVVDETAAADADLAPIVGADGASEEPEADAGAAAEADTAEPAVAAETVEAAIAEDPPAAVADSASDTVEASAGTSAETAADGTTPASSPSSGSSPLASEEMMAAMLKPMLKEWLDANMPRLVAKAMGDKDDDDPSPA
jgi:cell pole-organizing protein PopZ